MTLCRRQLEKRRTICSLLVCADWRLALMYIPRLLPPNYFPPSSWKCTAVTAFPCCSSGYAASAIGLSILFQFYRAQPLWIPIGWNVRATGGGRTLRVVSTSVYKKPILTHSRLVSRLVSAGVRPIYPDASLHIDLSVCLLYMEV